MSDFSMPNTSTSVDLLVVHRENGRAVSYSTVRASRELTSCSIEGRDAFLIGRDVLWCPRIHGQICRPTHSMCRVVFVFVFVKIPLHPTSSLKKEDITCFLTTYFVIKFVLHTKMSVLLVAVDDFFALLLSSLYFRYIIKFLVREAGSQWVHIEKEERR